MIKFNNTVNSYYITNLIYTPTYEKCIKYEIITIISQRKLHNHTYFTSYITKSYLSHIMYYIVMIIIHQVLHHYNYYT